MSDLLLYKVDADYLEYLHSFDNRVSLKFDNRPFVGIVTMVNNSKYLIPLTSQTNHVRKKKGLKPRRGRFTTHIMRKNNSNEETNISDLLYNNMIPVKDSVISIKEIDVNRDTYELSELRFIRKNAALIKEKAQKVYKRRLNGGNFEKLICCDFLLLEEKCNEYAA